METDKIQHLKSFTVVNIAGVMLVPSALSVYRLRHSAASFETRCCVVTPAARAALFVPSKNAASRPEKALHRGQSSEAEAALEYQLQGELASHLDMGVGAQTDAAP